jgi:hypothetical protein
MDYFAGPVASWSRRTAAVRVDLDHPPQVRDGLPAHFSAHLHHYARTRLRQIVVASDVLLSRAPAA